MKNPDYIVIVDGSQVYMNHDDKRRIVSASAGIIVDTNRNTFSEFSEYLGEYHIGYAEFYGVKKALRWIMKREKHVSILIVSDRMEVVRSINSGRYKPSKSKSTDKLRKWIYFHALQNPNYKISAIHIKSHPEEISQYPIKYLKRYFNKSGVKADWTTTQSLKTFNDRADRMAKNVIIQTCNNDGFINLIRRR